MLLFLDASRLKMLFFLESKLIKMFLFLVASRFKMLFCFQVGLSRSTTGCVCACLFREFQLTARWTFYLNKVIDTQYLEIQWGYFGFWAKYLKGVLGVTRKSNGGPPFRVHCIFTTKLFKSYLLSPLPLCASRNKIIHLKNSNCCDRNFKLLRHFKNFNFRHPIETEDQSSSRLKQFKWELKNGAFF
jgi:hypothetical protein